jgi:UDP-glucose 4-epimerase
MHVLITGASGLVGSRIAQHLSLQGLHLRLASRSQLPYTLINSSACQVDWDSQSTLDSACKDVDVVVHASGMNSQDSVRDPIAALLVNGVGTARLRLAASRAGIRRIIYFSSAHVYRSPLVGTITEDTCPLNLHPYATSHLAGESALYSPSNLSGPDIIVLRMSNAFGAPLHPSTNCWGLLANDLCKQAVTTRTLCLATSGSQTRNFIPLALVCLVVEKLLARQSHHRSYQIFNLGGRSMLVSDFAKLIQAHASNLLGEVIPLDIPLATVPSRKLDLDYSCSRLAKYLDFSPPNFEFEIDQLLRFCLHHFAIY